MLVTRNLASEPQTIQTVSISHVSGTGKICWDIDIDINFSQAV
jgi:hypothetical protein